MTEGCNGGWGAFTGFFLENYYTVAEECAPYRGKTFVDGCQVYQDCEPIAKVGETYYIGGHYGGMSEESIMRELRANGPVLFDFDADISFQIYKSGILTQDEIESWKHKRTEQTEALEREQADPHSVSDRTYDDFGLQWEVLTHSTLVIGWGYDEQLKMKYWLVRNSYGPLWGEGGNLRVRRGMDDFGCEGENAAVTPILL